MKYRVEVYETKRVLCEYTIEADNAAEARQNAILGIYQDREELRERDGDEPVREVLGITTEDDSDNIS
jgi:hypothetical protein